MHIPRGHATWLFGASVMLYHHIITALHSLYAEKQRTVLSLIGIVIGIASVIAMFAIGSIYKEEALAKYTNFGINMLSVKFKRAARARASRRENDGAIESPWTALSLMQGVQDKVASIQATAPYALQFFSYRLVKQRFHYSLGDLIGVTQHFKDVYQLRLQEGRFISDLDQTQNYIVLGSELVQQKEFNVFHGELIGKQITIGVLSPKVYTVIGILQPAPYFVLYPFLQASINRGALVPIRAYKQQFPTEEVRHMGVRLDEDADVKSTLMQIKHYFSVRIYPMQVKVKVADKMIQAKKDDANRNTIFLIAIGSIALIVSGFSIMNIMLTTVSARRKEIGILRAIGAKQSDIQWQFFTEAIILSFIGGVLGLMLGIGVTYLYAESNGMHFFISGLSIVFGFVVSLSVGTFFGFYPAYKAARLDPIEALR